MSVLQEVSVFKNKPQDFNPTVSVVAVYVEVGNEVLFLERARSEKGFWGVPAGKVEGEETLDAAAKRELFEETGIEIKGHSRFDGLGPLYIRKDSGDYTYHLFRLTLSEKPPVSLSDEHLRSLWASDETIEDLSLMRGARDAFLHYLAMSRNRARTGTNVNAYLVLKQGEEVLLHLRKNTSYYDGYYSLVAGHIEEGEGATEGLAREAKEEAGITIDPKKLKFLHCLHRRTNRLNIDLFFECVEWEGVIENKEPSKCEALTFFPLSSLPSNTVGYVAKVLQSSSEGISYSEEGWDD